MMKTGDRIRVEAHKADGTCYRWWETTIEECSENHIVTISPSGAAIRNVGRGDWIMPNALRSYFWFDKPYNLIEAFKPDGTLVEIYINVASRPWVKNGNLYFTDHELDVSAQPPEPAFIADEDEFTEAALKFGYSLDFQREMYAVAEKALEIANHWQAKAPPTFGDPHAQ